MRRGLFAALALAMLAGCADRGAPTNEQIERLRSGELSADNVFIFHNDVRVTMGAQILSTAGDFEPAGPTIVCIFKAIPPHAADYLRHEGIRAVENTAYMLPVGADADSGGLKKMKRIGPIDPAQSDQELAAKFGFKDFSQ